MRNGLRCGDLRTSRHGDRKCLPASSGRRVYSLSLIFILFALLLISASGCRRLGLKQSVRPRTLRDVPAQRLAYRLQADVDEPPGAKAEDAFTRHPAIQADFDNRRKDDALVRTVVSPDGQRALALYETGDKQPGEFRIDLYGTSAGNFLRNVTPPELSGAFASTVAWSPDGNYIAFLGRKSLTPEPTPDPDDLPLAQTSPAVPSGTVQPIFAPLPLYTTEQIYICNRDGFDLKPLTTRDGLIYFHLAWAPDGHALASLACKEDEWDARAAENKLPAGRPRLVELNGQERLLDDTLTHALPVWSPDASKVATAFETDVGIYDTTPNAPTAARIPLREPLYAASVAYDEKKLQPKNKQAGEGGGQAATPGGGAPISFNPVIRLYWPQPEALFLQTGFVRTYATETVTNYMRWHQLYLSPQAALLSFSKRNEQRRSSRYVPRFVKI
jgi:hypothetical protein